jgi:hypothetical protein
MFPPAGRAWLIALGCLLCLQAELRAGDRRTPSVTVDPPAVRLHGPNARYSLLVSSRASDGRIIDRTRAARFRVVDPRIAGVTSTGIVRALADGKTRVVVQVDGHTVEVSVTVEASTTPRRFNFENDIVPVLGRFGCNSSGCHGKAEGQNGFKLSVFGFDPAADYAALVKESRGRRIFLAAPEQSLLLRKMSGQAPHGGGARIRAGTLDYEILHGWIAAGVPVGSSSDPRVSAVRIEPRERILSPPGERRGVSPPVRPWASEGTQQQLRVVARYTDGREVDVTGLARFQSNNEEVARVDADGLVRAGEVPGDAAIMASFMNIMDVCRVIVPRPQRIEKYPAIPEHNFIDKLVFAKLRKLNILPADLADDSTYLRRVYLDVIGTLPTPAEARRFLADRRPDRRARLVDELLRRPEFADYWALRWSDLLRVDRAALGAKRARAYHKWIRDHLVANTPWDRFAQAVITAEGPLDEVPEASFYKAVTRPGQMASSLAQVFLGVRIACAECHHHPFDRWSQTDYAGMQAFFTGVSIRGTPAGEALTAAGVASVRHPRGGEPIFAHALGVKMPAKIEPGDQRRVLADWLTSKDNPWFARNLANRTWAHFLGRGLVEPLDDVRATNPPSNPELLDALARHLVDNKFDLRSLIRTITASRVYQLSTRPNATNERDGINYSRALFKRVPAEVLLDMVAQTTGVPERFPGMAPGTRAIQLWDSKLPHYFLKVFGRPERTGVCECERNAEPSVAQVLHLLNAPEVQARLSHARGTVAKLVKRLPDAGPLVEELYLTFYSRLPNETERKEALAYLRVDRSQRRQAVEDLAWSLLNSLEFLFNH